MYAEIMAIVTTLGGQYGDDDAGNKRLKEDYFKATGQMPGEDTTRDEMLMALASIQWGQQESAKVDDIVATIGSVGAANGLSAEGMQRVITAMLTGKTEGLTLDELGVLGNMTPGNLTKAFGVNSLFELSELLGIENLHLGTTTRGARVDYENLKSNFDSAVYGKYEGFLGGLNENTIDNIVKQMTRGDAEDMTPE